MANGNINGLDINESAFMAMKSKEQNLILFKNVVHIRSNFKDYAFHRKVQYVWLSLLSALILSFVGLKNLLSG